MKELLSLCVLFLLIGTTTTTLSGSQSHSAKDRGGNESTQDRFIGAWRLAWLEEEGADGNIHRADCAGLLVYTRDGHMSVQVMYRNPQANSQASSQATTNAAPVQYAQGGYEAAGHLIALGRRCLAFIGGASRGCPEFLDRYRGFVRALEDARLTATPELQVDAITTEEAGYAATSELLRRGARFDAVVGASDLIALGAMHALQDHGIEVPAAVAVVGFDDIPAAGLANPPLTTIAQNTRLAGEVLVDTLLRQIRDEHAEGRMLPTRLVVRRSCGASPASAPRPRARAAAALK